MPRTARVAPGGWVYHMLNRAAARLPLFGKEADYAAFERVLPEAYERHLARLKRVGADSGMDYRYVEWLSALRELDAGLRTAGGAAQAR